MADFRKMRRAKQALDQEECIRLLTEEKRGVLSVIGDNGYPYCMPINHLYDPVSGHIYFHGGKIGHRVDAVKACDKACFCVYDSGFKNEGEWALNIKSVVVFGRLSFIDSHDEVLRISRELSCKFTSDEEYIADEIKRFADSTLCMELVPEHITGKQVKEA